MDTTQKNLIYLLFCAVNGLTPESERVRAMDMANLYRLSGLHKVRGAVCIALEKAGVQNEDFHQEMKKAVRKNILLDIERQSILADFERHGIWYMPLKGCILKDLYPGNGMREMSDNDILFDKEKRYTVRDIMMAHGYSIELFGKGNHDVYHKPPVLKFEMHVALFHRIHADNTYYRYYRDFRRLLKKDGNNNYGYHLSDEDFYVFMTVHEYKHYSTSGTDIRSLLDCYVYEKAMGDKLDYEYIREQMEQLGIANFERNRRTLAFKVFSSAVLPELTETEQSMLTYYLTSLTNAHYENSIDNKLQTRSKSEYLLELIFPSMEVMKGSVGFVEKCGMLYPLGVVWRLFRAFFCNGIITIKKILLIMRYHEK